MRKIIKWMMVLMMAVGCAAAMTIVAEAATEGDFTYTVSNGKATITAFNKEATGEAVIPDTLGGYPVTAIGGSAFTNCTSLKKITVPKSVTSIGQYAFKGCTSLEEMTLPFVGMSRTESYWTGLFGTIFGQSSTGVRQYDSSSGSGVPFGIPSSLRKVTVTDATKLSYGAFSNCSMLTEININEGITAIEGKAFYNCSGITEITVPGSVTNIGEYAFSGCTKLIKVDLPETITNISSGAFSGAPVAADENRVDGNLYIDNILISSKSGGTGTLKIREGTTAIADSAVSGRGYAEVILPDSVKAIGTSAFSSCRSLKTVVLGKALSNIKTNAFSGCSAIETAAYRGSSAEWADVTVASGNESLTNKLVKDSIFVYLKDVDGGIIATELTTARSRFNYEIVPEKAEHTYKLYADGAMENELDSNAMFMADTTVFIKYTINRYTYTFLNGDGTVFEKVTADYGSVIGLPENAPSKPKTQQYTFIFVDWNGYSKGMKLTGDISFTPNFDGVLNRYTYVFTDSVGSPVKKVTADYGTKIVAPGEAPKKTSTAKFDYIFAGWNGFSDGMTLTDDVTFTPSYTSSLRKYTYTFLNGDGSVLKSEKLVYGSIIPLPENDPVKARTPQYSYTFTEWDIYAEGMAITEDIVFEPIFKRTVNRYTYTFTDYIGNPVKTVTADYGTIIEAPETAPVKPGNKQYSYKFIGWENFEDKMMLTGDIEFAPEYSSVINRYKIVFKNADGSVFYEAEKEYGSVITAPSGEPSKESTKQYDFVFTGWEDFSEGAALRGNVEYAPIFTEKLRTYTYTFKNADGSVFDTGVIPYGTAIPLPEGEPEKANDEKFTYAFAGWAGYSEGMTIEGDITFEPEFEGTLNRYTYRFISNGEVVKEATADYGTVIEAPETAPEGEFPLIFSEWEGFTEGMELTGGIDFNAVFINRSFTVTPEGGEAVTVVYGDEFVLGFSNKPGQHFVGYFTGKDGEGDKITGSDGASLEPFTFDGDITVYPYYVEDLLEKIALLGDETVKTGEDAVYKVRFATAREVSELYLEIRYPESLEFKATNIRDAVSADLISAESADGFVTAVFKCVLSEEKTAFEAPVTPFEIVFGVGDGAEDFTIEILASSRMKGDEDFAFSEVFTAETKVNNVIPGDVTGDGEVNKMDALRLKKYLAGLDVEIDLAAADVNCDGVVNKMDALRLKKYLAGQDVKLGE